jgi:hypothetical protein
LPDNPLHCRAYQAGHDAHWIQAKLAREVPPADVRPGTVVSVADDGWITVRVDGGRVRFWNHDPHRAREFFRRSQGRVELPGYALLRAPYCGGKGCLSVSMDGPTPCHRG